MMQDSVVRTLERICPLDRVKSAVQQKEPLARDVWTSLIELGVPALLIPEAHGGLGLSLLDAALVSETLGRFASPRALHRLLRHGAHRAQGGGQRRATGAVAAEARFR